MSDIRDLFRTEPSIYAFVAIIMLVGPVKKNAMMIDLARERRSRIPSPSLRRRNRVKLRELAVTVAAPDRLAARLGASAVRLTVAGRNLLTWARYRGVDPEVSAAGQNGLTTEDQFTQPPVRYWTARLDLAF